MLNEVKHLSRSSNQVLARERCFTSFGMTAFLASLR